MFIGCVPSLYCRLGAGRMRASTSTKHWPMFICHACTSRLRCNQTPGTSIDLMHAQRMLRCTVGKAHGTSGYPMNKACCVEWHLDCRVTGELAILVDSSLDQLFAHVGCCSRL